MKHIMRYDKAKKFYELAKVQANLFSKDPHRKVGALFIDENSYSIRASGYNGFCRGVDETRENRWARPNKYMYVCHAEANGIYNACRDGTSLNHTVAVVTLFPCLECAKAMIQVGVKGVVAPKPDLEDERWGQQFREALDMFEEVGMKIMYVDT